MLRAFCPEVIALAGAVAAEVVVAAAVWAWEVEPPYILTCA